MVKTPKLFWSDLGVARHLMGHWGPLSGPLFEALVVAEAMKLVRTLSFDVEAAFYRTRSGLNATRVMHPTQGRETCKLLQGHR